MNSRVCKWVAAVALACLLAAVSPVQALADDVSRSQSESSDMMHKLGRGISNLFFGFVELPKNIAEEWKRTDPFTGLILGFIKGVGWGWARTMTGLYEIVTFPLPVPEGYVVIMEPEFILTDTWGDPIPEFNEPIEPISDNYPRY